MANIPFLTHPSFANVDRYEHSLGVAHLAWRWASRSRIPKDQALALTSLPSIMTVPLCFRTPFRGVPEAFWL